MGKLLAFLLLVGFIGSSTEEQCLMKSPCSCLDENGSGIDLSSLESSSYLTAVLGNTSFFYHPCKDGKEIPTPPDNVCNKDGFSLCSFDSTNNTYQLLGIAKDVTFGTSKESQVYLTFKNTYFIEIRCSAKSNNHPDVLFALNEHNFVLFSPASCYNHIEPSHHGFIYSLFIILIVFMFLYVIVGVLFRYFYMGARGMEIIPNLGFWKNTWWKLKQGSIYVMNGCKVTEANYDAI